LKIKNSSFKKQKKLKILNKHEIVEKFVKEEKGRCEMGEVRGLGEKEDVRWEKFNRL